MTDDSRSSTNSVEPVSDTAYLIELIKALGSGESKSFRLIRIKGKFLIVGEFINLVGNGFEEFVLLTKEVEQWRNLIIKVDYSTYSIFVYSPFISNLAIISAFKFQELVNSVNVNTTSLNAKLLSLLDFEDDKEGLNILKRVDVKTFVKLSSWGIKTSSRES